MATKKKGKVKEDRAKDRFWTWDKNHTTIAGEYIGPVFGVGPYGGVIFNVRDEKLDKVVTIGGVYAIRKALLPLKEGSYVKIVYKGIQTLKQKGKDGKPKKQFNFDITGKGGKNLMPQK